MIQYDSIWWCYMMMLWMGLWWFVNFFSACLETDWSDWGWIAYPLSSSADANGVQITTGSFWTLREDKSDLWITVLKITQNHPTTLTAFLAVQNVKKTLEFFGCGIAVSPPTAFQRHNSKAKSEIWLDRDHVTIVHLAQALCRKGLLQTKVGSCLARFR